MCRSRPKHACPSVSRRASLGSPESQSRLTNKPAAKRKLSQFFLDRLAARLSSVFVDDRRIGIDKQDICLAGCAACRNVRTMRTKRIKSLERSGVAQKRLRFVFLEFLWRGGGRSGKVIK
jgi:hypothetical protein